jgi:tetratricopeptide (TPR) repeat protein
MRKALWIVVLAVIAMAGSLMAGSLLDVQKLMVDKKFAEANVMAKELLPTLKGLEKVQAQQYIGSTLISQDKVDEGIAELKKIATMAEATEANKDGAVIAIAGALRNAKRYPEALALYQSKTESKTDAVRCQAKRNVGQVLLLQGKLPEAIIAYEVAIADPAETNEFKADSYTKIGRAYLTGIKNTDKALQAYKQVILLTANTATLAEGMRAKKLVGAKELAVTLKGRQGTKVFDSLLGLTIEKVFDEKTTLTTYEQVVCLAEMQAVITEVSNPAELSKIWSRINILTGIVGVNRFAVEEWLKKNK